MLQQSRIKVLTPVLPNYLDLQPYLARIDDSNIYSNFGPLVKEFEARLARHFNISEDNLATCSNGTDAIEGAIRTSGGIKSRWEIPSWTFTASAAALYASGADFTFRDIDKSGRIRNDEKFKNIIEVLPFGESIDLSRYSYSYENLIFDAAASFDALTALPINSEKRFAAVVSFHATKTLSTGEGGLFISNDVEWVKSFKKWTNFGMWGNRISETMGSNSKMNEYSAAIGLASMDLWPQNRQRWLKQMKYAQNLSLKYKLQTNSALIKGLVSPYWIVRLTSSSEVKRLTLILDNLEIDWRRWWEFGCHKMSAYTEISREDLSETEKESKVSIGLPLHLNLTESNWQRIEIALQTLIRP